MNTQEEKAFGQFLIEKKKVLSPENFQICLEVQQALKKWGIEKTIDKVIVEKGFLDSKQIATLLREHRGGDEDLIRGYRIVSKLGEGAMGEVFQAIDLENNNRSVAIKILYPHLGKHKATAQRFIQEARLCIEKLNHPNIVKGYEVGYEANNDFFFYVMELIEGCTLNKILKERGVFSEKLAIHIMKQMGSALQHAFEFNLVHRDIKPDNIMLTTKGDAKLCDLGLARDWGGDLSLTRTGAVMGTPFYISPEAAGGLKLDSRSDIYSLGATIYHMIVGVVPFNGPNSAVVLNRHRCDPLIPPIAHRHDLTPGLSAIVELMMAKRPEDRYQTPMEMLIDIEKLERNETPNALSKLRGGGNPPKTIRRGKTQVLEAIPASEGDEEPEDSSDFSPVSRIEDKKDLAKEQIEKPTPKQEESAEPIQKKDTPEQIEDDSENENESEIEEVIEPDAQEAAAISTVKIENKILVPVKRQDNVEEYQIRQSESWGASSSEMPLDHNKREQILNPFFTTTEQRILSKAKKAQSKLLFIGAVGGGAILVVVLVLVYLLIKILARFLPS